MIIGNIFKGLKRIIEYNVNDLRELSEIQNILLCRLSAAPEESDENISEQSKKSMIKAIKEIDRILN